VAVGPATNFYLFHLQPCPVFYLRVLVGMDTIVCMLSLRNSGTFQSSMLHCLRTNTVQQADLWLMINMNLIHITMASWFTRTLSKEGIESTAMISTSQHWPKPKAVLDPLGDRQSIGLRTNQEGLAILSTFKPSRTISGSEYLNVSTQCMRVNPSLRRGGSPAHLSTAMQRSPTDEILGTK